MQDALGLKKMTAFMADNDLESRTDSESNSRDKRIPKVNAVDVFGARADHEFPAGSVSSEKALENGKADARRGPNLRGSRSTLGLRRRLDKAADKPAREPSGSNIIYGGIRLLFQRSGDGRKIGFVCNAEMFETLAHAPAARRRLPIELCLGESSDKLLCGLVVGVKVRSKAHGPSGRPCLLWCGHNADYRRIDLKMVFAEKQNFRTPQAEAKRQPEERFDCAKSAQCLRGLPSQADHFAEAKREELISLLRSK
jgi:hypothetical protein